VITLAVTGASKAGATYNPSDNHDDEGDSTGTINDVLRPGML
jgi:hypothetical protein